MMSPRRLNRGSTNRSAPLLPRESKARCRFQQRRLEYELEAYTASDLILAYMNLEAGTATDALPSDNSWPA